MAVGYRNLPPPSPAPPVSTSQIRPLPRQGMAEQPVYRLPPWKSTQVDHHIDPRLTATGDRPTGVIPNYVPFGVIDPRNVYSMAPQ